MTARVEQETTITFVRDDPVAYVHTSNTSHLRELRKKAASTDFVSEVRGADGWADFTVHVENFKPLLSIRGKASRSAAQVAASVAAGERLAKIRKEKAR